MSLAFSDKEDYERKSKGLDELVKLSQELGLYKEKRMLRTNLTVTIGNEDNEINLSTLTTNSSLVLIKARDGGIGVVVPVTEVEAALVAIKRFIELNPRVGQDD